MAIAGFKDLNLYELSTYDFSIQCLRDWVTDVSSKIEEAFTDTIPLFTMLAYNATCTDKYTEKNVERITPHPIATLLGPS